MKKTIFGTCLSSMLGLALLMLGSISASAGMMPTPGSGPAFGQHVAAMSPGHDGMVPGSVGSCVSNMAIGVMCAMAA